MKGIETVFSLDEWNVKFGKSPFQDEDTFYLENKQTEKIEELAEIISDLPYQKMQRAQIKQALTFTYPRLAMLSDGSYKLYIFGRLAGGGFMDDEQKELCTALQIPTISNEALTKKIIRITKGAFSDVNVQTNDVRFSSGVKIARIITVKPSSFQYLQNFITAICREKHTINCNRTALAILGSNNPQDRKELEMACKKNPQFKITISLDLEQMNVEFETDNLTGLAENLCILL